MLKLIVLLASLVVVLAGVPSGFGQCYTLPSPDSNEVRIFAQDVCGSVDNNPPNPTVFTINQSRKITKIGTYHWNNGQGTQAPGTIGLQDQSGKIYGPWQASGQPGMGGVPNANWIATIQAGQDLHAGTYKVLDSDPSTWAYNSESDNRGVVSVVGLDVGATPVSDCTQNCNVCSQPPCTFCQGYFGYTPDLSTSELIFEVYSPMGVSSSPGVTSFTILRDRTITDIGTYHWYSQPGSVGTIGLQNVDSGTIYGPWQASGYAGMNGKQDVYWVVSPYVYLPAGTYKIVDSDQSTWSYTPNDCTGSKGHCWVFAQKAFSPTSNNPTGLPGSLQECDTSLTSTSKTCGTWTLQGNQYYANWENGATAILTVDSWDASGVVINRHDYGGTSAGLSARYEGQLNGNAIENGKSTWTFEGSTHSGTWTANW
jgi:hypothetical protein